MTNHEKWYGDVGIDTAYERSLIRYRPNLIYPEKEASYPMNKESIIKISRSQDFMISKAILDYRGLAERIAELLAVLEERQEGNIFQTYMSYLEAKDLSHVFEVENQEAGYSGSLDYELYTMLYFMMHSVSDRADFLDNYYRVQVTDKTENEDIVEEEGNSINEWIKTEYDLSETYDQLTHGSDDMEKIEEKINALEVKRRKLDLLHTTMGDISYVHRNRYLLFEEIVSEAEHIVHQPNFLIEGNMRLLLTQLGQTTNRQEMKTHLILTFKEHKTQHTGLKQQYVMIDDQKENVASEREYMYQQIVLNTNDPIRDWLYEQSEDTGRSMDLFAEIMIDSVNDSKKKYEESLADMLNFYQNEASFYGRQFMFIKKKEQIRLFLQIIEDLEETEYITDEWVEQYLRVNAYES